SRGLALPPSSAILCGISRKARTTWRSPTSAKCCARVLRPASCPAKLAGPIAVRSTPASLAGCVVPLRGSYTAFGTRCIFTVRRAAGSGACLWRLLMPDRRQHRGPHPDDAALFGRPDVLHTLRLAAGDLAWLLGRQYAPTAALTLVGNHYQLHARQRQALARAVAAPAVAGARRQRQVLAAVLAGTSLYVDGFNQLITIEVALSGGLILRGHDGALRDLASVHGTYRTITETPTALQALGSY